MEVNQMCGNMMNVLSMKRNESWRNQLHFFSHVFLVSFSWFLLARKTILSQLTKSKYSVLFQQLHVVAYLRPCQISMIYLLPKIG